MLMKVFLSPMGLILGSAFLFLVQLVLTKPMPVKRSEYLPPPQIIQNMAVGLNIQMADSFWLRALQDFDYCDQPLNSTECKGESWLYHVVDLTTDLDKKFRDAYFFGAMSLSVLVSDYDGASKIFDKGILQFPNDWQLNYAAGYHVLFEENNKAKAAKLYYAAAENGAPGWVKVLAGRLANEGGEKEFAAQILEQMIKTSQKPELIERLQKKLSSYNQQL
ncbi:MAG: hypothetical protein H7328_06110 [Bdellovibrio sp.]|nr:hypothetical protein [Bdellovibrio sp.]